MVRFDAAGDIVDSRSILSGTFRNCSGGPTPWGTWLSCEEISRNGQVYECDPFGVEPAVVRPAMGAFGHEAAAVDPETSIVYLTEDQRDGGLYRFIPTIAGDLSTGVLEVMTEVGGVIDWAVIPDPRGRPIETRFQVPTMKIFNRGEGAFFAGGRLVVASTGDDRVWSYTPSTNELEIIYDEDTSPEPVLSGSDNVTIADVGDVFVCEDGGNLELVVVPVEGGANPFLRVEGQSDTELTGVAFDPSGTRLYFSSQRHPGQTYEITGPFRTSVPEPDPGVFACSLDGGVLSWSDQGASRYFVRSINGGVETYVGGTAGLSLAVSGTDEQYLVRFRIDGVVTDAICDGNVAGEPDPAPEPDPTPDPAPDPVPVPTTFECSISNGVLSWNDQGASRYFVRAINGGQQTFIGSSTSLSLPVTGADEQYLVRHWVDGAPIDAICQP